jgi:hypothetical protein
MILLCSAAFIYLLFLVVTGQLFKPEKRVLISVLSGFSSVLFGWLLTWGGGADIHWAVTLGLWLCFGAPVWGIAIYFILKRISRGDVP